MLTKQLLDALRGYTANMQNDVHFILQTGEHSKRAELLKFLQDFASVSARLSVVEKDAGLRSPVSFTLEVDEHSSGIVFSGVPGGHEFNSLVLAVLQLSGTDPKLDEGIRDMIAAIEQPLHFQTFVSLSCHNCPDVVQALNAFAAINQNVTHEMIDGGLFPDLVENKNIQGVPTVYLDDDIFANGKIDTATLLDKLMDRYPDAATGNKTTESKLPLQDVTVIGGGPAGISAAIYIARKGLAVTIIADRFGGQVKDTMGIENLISVPMTTGPELTDALKGHLSEYDVTTREFLRVDNIEDGDIKTVVLSSGERIDTKTVIVATGAKWRELGVPGEQENIGNGVAYCPHCDGPFFKGKDVAVIGGGNSGIEAAIDLAGIVKSVTVFEFLPELKADQILVERAQASDNIKILKNVATQEILADNGKVNAIKYQDRASGGEHTETLAGVFIQIGLIPNSEFLKGLVDLTEYGEVIVDDKCATNVPGIFACGDVTTTPYKQIVVALGEGSKAALAAFEHLLMYTQPEELKEAV
ncbi:MAG: alkyl hydroperoxide reductase subunit F [Pseudomonadota bacterium]